jgi:hypothetical protein
MAVTLNASTSTGLIQTADTSGNLELQSSGTTKLTVNSSGVTIPTLTTTTVTGTIVQGTAVASTSGTSIDFTSIPSWVKKITVMFSGVSTSGTSIPLIQLADAGGVEATGYLGGAGIYEDGPTVITTAQTTGFGINASHSAAYVIHGSATISSFGSNQWIYSSSMANSSATNPGACFTGGGSKTLTDTLTQIRITTVNGTDTFDAGSINIQYEG